MKRKLQERNNLQNVLKHVDVKNFDLFQDDQRSLDSIGSQDEKVLI